MSYSRVLRIGFSGSSYNRNSDSNVRWASWSHGYSLHDEEKVALTESPSHDSSMQCAYAIEYPKQVLDRRACSLSLTDSTKIVDLSLCSWQLKLPHKLLKIVTASLPLTYHKLRQSALTLLFYLSRRIHSTVIVERCALQGKSYTPGYTIFACYLALPHTTLCPSWMSTRSTTLYNSSRQTLIT